MQTLIYDVRYALRQLGKSSRLHFSCGTHFGSGNRRQHRHLYVGQRCSLEVIASAGSPTTLPRQDER